ncbi:MAG: beta-propeller fold lactonase family protein [Deltaproteobacteria bacterium]|nr:beta-propeller fold lactonase family protein [Deltaproteobacteria bacterium]
MQLRRIIRLFGVLAQFGSVWVCTSSPLAAGVCAYVTNSGSGDVTVIEATTHTPLKTIAVGSLPRAVAIRPDGRFVYVANGLSRTISVIATSTQTVTATFPSGRDPRDLAVSSDGQRLYVTNGSSDAVSVFDAADGTPVGEIPVGNGPRGIALSPDDQRAYVVTTVDDTLAVVDTAAKQVVDHLALANGPLDVAVAADGKLVYVTDGNAVSVIHAGSGLIVLDLRIGNSPRAVALSADGARLYAVNGNALFVIDVPSHVIDTSRLITSPRSLAVTPDSQLVYVTTAGGVVVLDPTAHIVAANVVVGADPTAIAITESATVVCSGPVSAPATATPAAPPPSMRPWRWCGSPWISIPSVAVPPVTATAMAPSVSMRYWRRCGPFSTAAALRRLSTLSVCPSRTARLGFSKMPSSWRTTFRDRLLTADAAARRVSSGDLLRLPMGPVPVTLVNALARRRDELRGVRVMQGATRHPLPFASRESGWHGSIDFSTDFLTVLLRPAMEARTIDFAVTDYALGSRTQKGGRRNIWSADVFMALVSEPDSDGYVSFGYSLWHSKQLLGAAKLAIAEIGRDVLRTGGDNRVHLSEFDFVVEQSDMPNPIVIPDLSPERIEVTEVIGAYVSTLVNDGDTLQIGTGTLSSLMGNYLVEKNDIGIDAEILVASGVELVKLGVANGSRKTYHPGVATGSFIVPGADFEYCDGNPRFGLYDIEWCNSVPRISTIENLVAINQASTIDLTGQVASESIGPVMYTGPGGQLAWTMGALYAPGGRAILVLPSTAKQGRVSRIVSSLAPGTIVTVPRTYVDYVVTEHGIANLQGLTQRERVTALLELAAPEFRDQLRFDARRLFWP